MMGYDDQNELSNGLNDGHANQNVPVLRLEYTTFECIAVLVKLDFEF